MTTPGDFQTMLADVSKTIASLSERVAHVEQRLKNGIQKEVTAIGTDMQWVKRAVWGILGFAATVVTILVGALVALVINPQ